MGKNLKNFQNIKLRKNNLNWKDIIYWYVFGDPFEEEQGGSFKVGDIVEDNEGKYKVIGFIKEEPILVKINENN